VQVEGDHGSATVALFTTREPSRTRCARGELRRTLTMGDWKRQLFIYWHKL